MMNQQPVLSDREARAWLSVAIQALAQGDEVPIERRLSHRTLVEMIVPYVREVAGPPSSRTCSAPVQPGSHNARAAFRDGCEDEHIDRMRNTWGYD